MSDTPAFYVKSDNCDFASRQKNIFDQLNLIESETKYAQQVGLDVDVKSDPEDVSLNMAVVKKKRSETKHLRGKESIFKRPEALPPRFKSRNIPDYRRHPNKWVKYTLGDVSSEDMSERSNTATAMAFLQEMEERKMMLEVESDTGCKKIKFKPRAHYSKKSDDTSFNDIEKGLYKSSKLVMPEYVVGREKRNAKRKEKKEILSTGESKRKEIKLDHLAEEEDEH